VIGFGLALLLGSERMGAFGLGAKFVSSEAPNGQRVLPSPSMWGQPMPRTRLSNINPADGQCLALIFA
jgi:hypothetical protein